MFLSGSEGSSTAWLSFLIPNYSRVYKQEHEVCFSLSLSFILLHTYSKYLAPHDLIGAAASAKSNEKWKSKAPLSSQLACLAAGGSSLNSGCCSCQVRVQREGDVFVCTSLAAHPAPSRTAPERQGTHKHVRCGRMRPICHTLSVKRAKRLGRMPWLNRGFVLWNANLRSRSRLPLIWKDFASCSPVPSL